MKTMTHMNKSHTIEGAIALTYHFTNIQSKPTIGTPMN